VWFVEGEGPRLEPLANAKALGEWQSVFDEKALAPIYETVRRVKTTLDDKTTLIGFCGAPWTVATYMVAGQGTPDQAPALWLSAQEPERFGQLIDRLTQASIAYLVGQLKAGADVLQIFDTWAGVLPDKEFDRWCIAPTRKIIEGVRAQVPDAKFIGFPRNAGPRLGRYMQQTGINCVGLDWGVTLGFARELQA
jgi:uroporphyrinogen decarboxylase